MPVSSESSQEKLLEVFELIDALTNHGFRFSIVHNAEAKSFRFCSVTDCDRMKKLFPQLNIYLSGNGKTIEYYIHYE